MRFGADVRLLRRERGWSQARLGAEIGVSRWVVSEIELGRGGRFRADVLARVVSAIGAYVSLRVMYHGEALDRLRDRRHARLVEMLVRLLVADGREVATEVSFNHFGERGSIDVLAYHAATGSLIVIEVKTVVPDVGGMLATLDRKVRLAKAIAESRGWKVASVSRLLVLGDTRTSRRRVTDHSTTFRVGFPSRGVEVRRWLTAPRGAIAGLMFLPDAETACKRRR